MSVIKKEIEARGSNVEAAIRNGLERLGVKREDVVVEVLDEGSRGLLGLGSRDAVVRLQVISYIVPEPAQPKPAPKPVSKPEPKPKQPPVVRQQVEKAPARPPAPQPEPKPAPKPAPPAPKREPEPVAAALPSAPSVEEVPALAETAVSDTPPEDELATTIVAELLTKMACPDVEITRSQSEPDDLTGERVTTIQVTGDDLGILIGNRGETLDSLQYIARLIVSHKRQDRASFVIDVQQYRERRQIALTRMAERMAKKAVQRNRPVVLEAMPAHERRIIHMALRQDEQVSTNSIGEGKRRRVKITPQ